LFFNGFAKVRPNPRRCPARFYGMTKLIRRNCLAQDRDKDNDHA
jgi:hypothetical protein